MPTFNFTFVKPKQKRSSSRAEYVSKIDKSVEGIIYVNDEGNFVIKHNETFYTPSHKSFITKNKEKLFVFSLKERSGILIYNYINGANDLGYPFMTLAPAYKVKGDIIEDINKNRYFDVKKVLDEFDSEARKEYLSNKEKIIKLYNERSKTSESC